jgi:hypothetical protein
MISIITYQIDGNKSRNNLSTHHQAYVYESFHSQQPSHALWSHQFFSMIDGHVHHIMKVLEDSTPHLHIFDFSSTT